MGDGFKAPTNKDINDTSGRSSDELATNIADKTLDILRDIAISNDMVIITRPVNKVAFAHMQAGAAGKNMFVHGKSAPDNTIAQGLIPMQSSISKAGKNDNVDKIKTYNAENAHSIDYSTEKFQEIEEKLKAVVEQRIIEGKPALDSNELLKEAKIPREALDPLVAKVPLLDKDGNNIYIFEDDKGRAGRDPETREPIYAIKIGEKYQRINLNHEVIDPNLTIPDGFKEVAVEVIGKPEIEITADGSLKFTKVNPVTADIDILAYGARTNLQEFDKITDHSQIVRQEKSAKILESNIELTDSIRQSLIQHEVDKVLDTIPANIREQEGFSKLINDLKNIEVIRENLRGMGEGSDIAMALTGHMREEFRSKVEISHGAEQFNIHFTQPMDSEWVVVDNKGKVNVIKGEKELLATFNKFTEEGLSIPPNPNWGWKLNGSKYEIDPVLKKISKECDNIRLQYSGASKEQREEIKTILDLQTSVGIESIKSPGNDKAIKESKKELKHKMSEYNKKYLQPEQKPNLVEKIHNMLSKISIPKGMKNVLDKIKDSLSNYRSNTSSHGVKEIPHKHNKIDVQR